MSNSELILLLFSQCGVTNQQGICEYRDRNFTAVTDSVSIAEAGPGVKLGFFYPIKKILFVVFTLTFQVYTAMWQLALALLFKLVRIIEGKFT